MPTPSPSSHLSDRLRAIPAPAALALIAGASFVIVPGVAGMFGANSTTAQANPANGTGRTRTGQSGLASSMPATMPTYMPSLSGSTPPATYSAPAAVASTGYAAGGGDGTSLGGAGGGGAGGSSNARQRQPKAVDQARTPPVDHPRAHLVPRGLGDPQGNRHTTIAATGPVYHHDLPAPVRRDMSIRAAPAPVPQAVPGAPRFAFVRPVAPMPFFGGGGMHGGGFRSFGGGGRHR